MLLEHWQRLTSSKMAGTGKAALAERRYGALHAHGCLPVGLMQGFATWQSCTAGQDS